MAAPSSSLLSAPAAVDRTVRAAQWPEAGAGEQGEEKEAASSSWDSELDSARTGKQAQPPPCHPGEPRWVYLAFACLGLSHCHFYRLLPCFLVIVTLLPSLP